MLHILLLILKIIGIIILVLLGLLLLAACCILFVPVRYRAHAHYDETAGAQAKISWLLRLIYLKAELAPETEGFHLVLKILGITFFDNQKPKKKKPEKKKPERKVAEPQKPEKAAGEQDKPALPEAEQPAAEADKSALPEANKQAVEAGKSALQEAEQPAAEAGKSALQEANKPAAAAGKSALPEAEQPAAETDKPALPEAEPPTVEKPDKPATPTPDHPDDPQEKMPSDRIETQSDEHTIDESEHEHPTGIGDKLRHFFCKIKEKLLGILSRIQSVAASVKNFFSHMADTRNSLLTKLGNVAAKKNAVWAILIDEKNRTAFLKVKKLVFRILHHLQPTKLDIRLEFGFDDPASTGYTLGLLSLLYPVYTDHIRLCPDFENKVFKGECTARGRLRASVFLFVVCQLIFDKDVRRILKSFKNI